VASRAEEDLVAELPALSHYTGDTASLLMRLQAAATYDLGPEPDALIDVARLSKRVKGRMVVDLLMHQNRYKEVVELVRRERIGRHLEFRVARLEALGSIGAKNKRYLWLREKLMNSLLASEGTEFVATLAKLARGEREKEAVYQRIRGLSDEKRQTSEVIEASLELAYEFGLNGQFDRATSLLDGSLKAAEVLGEIVLVARSYIIQSSILIQRYHQEESEVLIERIISEASKAMSLLDEPIVNDMYFYSQARNNRATGLRLAGDHLRALEDYRRNLIYFRRISVNHTIHTLYNMSVAYVALGDIEEARQALQEALRLNSQGGRSYLLEKIESLMAEIDSASDDRG
jgi:tetratricopeptide (TPR) repeat protein